MSFQSLHGCVNASPQLSALQTHKILGDLPGVVSEFGVPAVALQNKSSTLSIIECPYQVCNPVLIGGVVERSLFNAKIITRDDSDIYALVCFAKVARYCCFEKICSVKLSKTPCQIFELV